ncbi:MAG: MORN repeat-containing protein [Campylobacterales bacterium]
MSKIATAITIFTLLIGNIFASDWIADKNGCKAWNQNPVANEYITWSGKCENGYIEGKGALQFYVDDKKGSTSEGSFSKGKRHGFVVVTYSDSEKFEGNFVDDIRSGKGAYTSKNMAYRGMYANNKPDGQGVMSWANGDSYEGDFKDGNRTGKGIYLWANGNKYHGDFKDGNRSGFGLFTWASGSKYEGEWVNGDRTGFGIIRLHKKEEKAIKTYGNNGSYEGNYYVVSGRFNNGRLMSKSQIPKNIQSKIDDDAKADFEKAKKMATVESYKQFLEYRPNTTLRTEIVALLDKKIEPEYQKALKQKSSAALQEFADKYPMSLKSKEALAAIEKIKEAELKEQAISEAKKFNKLGHCAAGETVYHRETWSSTTSSGNVLADALFGAATKESFIIEFEGIVKGFTGNKVEVYLQDYAVKQTRGGGILQPVTGAKGRIAEYADKKVGRVYFYDKSRCGN